MTDLKLYRHEKIDLHPNEINVTPLLLCGIVCIWCIASIALGLLILTRSSIRLLALPSPIALGLPLVALSIALPAALVALVCVITRGCLTLLLVATLIMNKGQRSSTRWMWAIITCDP